MGLTLFAAMAGAVLAGGLALGAGFTHVAARRLGERYPPLGRFVDVEGVRLHLLERPGAPGHPSEAVPLVVAHGASANLREPLMALDPLLGGRVRTIYVDRPGHGWSDRAGPEQAAPAEQARLVAAALARLGIARAVILGISWGGALAAAFALEHPERTAGLVFVGPATHPWPGGVDWHYSLSATPVAGRLFAHCLMLPLAWSRVPRAIEGVFAPEEAPPGYAEAIGARLLLRPSEFIANGEDVHYLKGHVSEMAPRYPGIRAPAEIVSGEADAVVWPSIHAEGLARDIPGARLTSIAGAGHMPHHTRPQDVLDAITRVYARITAG